MTISKDPGGTEGRAGVSCKLEGWKSRAVAILCLLLYLYHVSCAACHETEKRRMPLYLTPASASVFCIYLSSAFGNKGSDMDSPRLSLY